MANKRAILLSFLIGSFWNLSNAKKLEISFHSNKYYSAVCDEYKSCSMKEGNGTGASHAYGMYNDDVMTEGWGKLWVHGDNSTQGWYESGFVEGALTAQRIYQHFKSWYGHQFGSAPAPETLKFLEDQYEYASGLAKTIPTNAEEAIYFQRIGQVLSQFEGVFAGLNYAANEGESLSKIELLMLEAAGDLYDIIPATVPSKFKLKIGKLSASEFDDEWHKVVSCSAGIKVASDLSDVFVGHTTWTSYTGMLRIYKNYNLAGGDYQVSFSAKPGSIYSKDDFYVLPNKRQSLVVLETTNGVLNQELYKRVVPTTLLTWQRIPLSNSLATNGADWVTLFSKHQSGTYCNQYMIVDMKKFIPHRGVEDGFLTIAEVIPGEVFTDDVTNVMRALGNYWPSFNIPYFKSNYIIAGYQNAFVTYGAAYSYDNCTRANMMRRDFPNIQSLEDMGAELRMNNYKTDVYALGDPSNAISQRKDLKTTSPSASGGIDSKVSSYKRLMEPLSRGQGHSIAQSGPTHENADLPPFRWSTSGNMQNEVHLGQPDVFDFPFIDMNFYEN